MNKRKVFWGVGILILATGGLFFSSGTKQLGLHKKIETSEENIEQKIFLTINDGEALKSFETNFETGMTAFDLLKKKTDENNINLETQNSASGIFINAIGDKKNGDGTLYWLYYINGDIPMVSADNNLLNPGDRVEFKFEKSPF
jgi:hypothetical protein